MHRYYLFIVLYTAVISVLVKTEDIVENSPCNNNQGICKKFLDCDIAKQQYRNSGNHQLIRCGFKNSDEIVCCPNKKKRKSQIECEKLVNEVGKMKRPQISGGEDAELGQFPHMAALGHHTLNNDLQWTCGAALISNRFFLTAAHCIINVDQRNTTMIRIGRIEINSTNGGDAQEFNIVNITVHPDFNNKLKFGDIALVKVDRDIKRSINVYPACLYTEEESPAELVATGWGITKHSDAVGSKILQKTSLEPVNLQECNETYIRIERKKLITSSHICARSPAGKHADTCEGDSGGPLQIKLSKNSKIYSIVGVTSTGVGCGGNVPGVYTRVSSYLDWIESIVWP